MLNIATTLSCKSQIKAIINGWTCFIIEPHRIMALDASLCLKLEKLLL